MKRNWFITGISRGLGRALAEEVLARGDTVIGTVRTGQPEITQKSGSLHILPLEISDASRVKATVEKAFAIADPRLDVIVNNAGYGLLGAFEDATDAEVASLFNVDVFGPLSVIRAALPHLRAQGSGHIVNITSIAGRAPIAGSSIYAAAKFALEGFSLSLAQELAPLGIKITAVAPGSFRTDFLSEHSIRKSTAISAGYEESVGKVAKAFDSMAGRQLGDPARGAAAILNAVDADRPPLQLLLGSDALHRARNQLDEMIKEMDKWADVAQSTDFPEGE